MTLVEFVAPVVKGLTRDKCLATLYFEQAYNNRSALTVEQLRKSLISARIPKAGKINVADVLSRSGHLVDSPGTEGNRRLWALTDSGRKHVRDLLTLPSTDREIEHDTATLEAIAAKLKDEDVREYVHEAIKCLRVGALRAAVVFLWTGAIRVLQEKALAVGASALNPAILKHDTKARHVSKIEDFAYVKDATTLLALLDLGLIDKGQKGILQEALDLRNRSGHPTKYKPGVKKVSAFIEDVVGIVF